jgi:hypothetical protein
MTSGSTVEAEHLAAMIVDAVEHAQRDDHHLGLDDLCARVSGFSAAVGSTSTKRTLIIAGRRCAETFVAAWLKQFPEDQAPILALGAVDSWIAEPTQEAAAHAASLSRPALDSFVQTKGPGQSSSWPSIAWFARSCAWLADAPQFGWQAVAALHGLLRAGARTTLVKQLAATIAEASAVTA